VTELGNQNRMTARGTWGQADDTDIDYLGRCLLRQGEPVDTGHWQSLKGVPQVKTVEMMNVRYELSLPQSMEELQDATQCNLPWAEEQFQERVGGVPLNPGETYKKWPWYRGNVPTHQSVVDEHTVPKFSHTYMERFWPKNASPMWNEAGCQVDEAYGIRYNYGDLNDVVSLLAREPHTRQAYLPIFFPEDTGAHHGERVPCTLGYHFLLRDGKLHINYFIRSCDFLRHFRDDVYLAGRLCQWMIEAVRQQLVSQQDYDYERWQDTVPGTLTMFISSLHVFEGDTKKMVREYG
jgi:hypothetical protein